MRFLLKAHLLHVLCASFLLADHGHALFRYHRNNPSFGLATVRKQTRADSQVDALKIPPGGSGNEEEKDEENFAEPTDRYDASEDHSDHEQEAELVMDDFDIPSENEYDDNSNIEIIPFDEDSDANQDQSSAGDVEIIPFDEECNSNEERSSTEDVQSPPLDEECNSNKDRSSAEDVEIIPVDEDSNFNGDLSSAEDASIVPFDEECKFEEVEDANESFDEEADSSDSQSPESDRCQEAHHTCKELDVEIQNANDMTDGVFNATSIPGDGHVDNIGCQTNIGTRETQISLFPTLRRRILELLQNWREQDIKESSTDSLKHLIHERSREYIDELLEFEIFYKELLSQNRSLPVLQKAAPHPKKVLNFIAPKIQTIRANPEIMLQIRSAKPGDVSIAICTVGVVSCLVNLYSIVLKKLETLGGDCDPSRKHDFNEFAMKSKILKDRRFEQLLECVSCGIDVKQRIQDFNENLSYDSGLGNDSDDNISRFGSDPTDDGGTVIDHSGYIANQQTENISASDVTRFMQSLFALGIDKNTAVGPNDAITCILALCMRLQEAVLTDYRKRAIDEGDRNLLLGDIVDSICVLTCAKESFNVDVDSIIQQCMSILAEGILTPGIDEDVDTESILDRLALSEEELLSEHEVCNATLKAANETKAPTSVDFITLTNSSDTAIRLVDYLSRKQQMLILKSFIHSNRLRGLSGEVLNCLVEKAIHQLDEEFKRFEHLRDEIEGHEIECVDAAILLASKIENDESKLEGVDRKIAVGTAPFIADPKSVSENEIKEGNSTKSEVFYRATFEIDESFDQENPGRTLYDGDFKGRTQSVRSKASHFDFSVYDCIMIVSIASYTKHELAPTALERCLQILESTGFATLEEMESSDITTFISGVAKITSTSEMDPLSLERITTTFRHIFKESGDSFSVWELSSLLHSLATLVSTQSSPTIHELVNEKHIFQFIEHSIQRILSSQNPSVWILANLSWSYVECNKFHRKSSWEYFEMLGRSASGVSSMLRLKLPHMTEGEHDSYGQLDCSILCKLTFALSCLDLDVSDLNWEIINHFENYPTLISELDTLDHIRLLYSIAKSEPSTKSRLSVVKSRVTNQCMKFVRTAAISERLSPYNMAIMLWTFGELSGEESELYSANFPVYSKEEIGVLSSCATLKLITGIMRVIGSQSVQTNTRIQMLLKNLTLRLDDQIDQMAPSELCKAGQILDDLREICITFLEDDMYNNPGIERDFIVDHDDNHDEEEVVINSLFPSSNMRDILHLCDSVLARVFLQAKSRIELFTSEDIKSLLNTLDFGSEQHQTMLESIQQEIEMRISLITHQSSTTNTAINEQIDPDKEYNSLQTQTPRVYASMRNFFSRDKKTSPDILSPENVTLDHKIEESPNVVDLLKVTLREDALNKMLHRAALEAAYDIGLCRQRFELLLQDEKSFESATTRIYP